MFDIVGRRIAYRITVRRRQSAAHVNVYGEAFQKIISGLLSSDSGTHRHAGD